MAPLRSGWTQVGAVRIHARVGGLDRRPRPPVVLVHGLGVSSRYFIRLARVLAGEVPVLAVDLPGFGRSDRPQRALDVAELADALADWVAAARIPRPALVGNSMGCQIAVDLAARRPELLGRLILIGPTMDPYARTALRQATRLLLDSARAPPSLLAILALDYAIFGPVRFARTAGFALADPIEEKLPHVRAPTLVVRGERDRIVPQRWAQEAADLLPRGRLEVVPGEPHACHYSAPTRVARLVRSFLEET